MQSKILDAIFRITAVYPETLITILFTVLQHTSNMRQIDNSVTIETHRKDHIRIDWNFLYSIMENTVIVLWGDHGWHLGEHNFWGKHNVLHLSTRSPLIISAPGFKSGQTCERLVEFVDLYPTLMDLVGINSNNKGLEGTSFKPLLETPRLKWKSAAFSKYGPARCLVTNQFNYAEFNDGKKMLFDLKTDPDENVNLAASPEHKKTLNRLGKMLKDGWIKVLHSEAKH